MADINIYGTLKNQTPEGVLAIAEQIMDEGLSKKQSQINQETNQAIEQINSKIETGLVFADEEDIHKNEEDKLSFADRTYNSEQFSGKGYKILRRNIQDSKNILTQDMINEENTIYEIRYDFDLNGNTIDIPENCILKFNGGSINNGILNGNNTNVDSSSRYTSILNTQLSGIWKIDNGYPEWFGAIGDGINDDRIAIQTAIDNCDIVTFRKTKYKLGIIYYQAGQQGNLFINKNVKLIGNDTELILDGIGYIFTTLGYSNAAPIYEEYRINPVELITENVSVMSNTIKIANVSKFNIGDTVLIRGEDSRINNDYEECDQWDINTIKNIEQDGTITLNSPIGFNIDITKCNRTGGISSPIINGSIIKINITSLTIDGFKFTKNTSGSVFHFYGCTNINLNNITVKHKNVASFKHCTNININNIIHEFSNSSNNSYGSLSFWGVRNAYVGNVIRHDCGITNNYNTIRVLSSEGRNYNIYAELIDYTTDIEHTGTVYCVYGDNIYINKLRITCKYIDIVTVAGINTFVNYLEIYGFQRLNTSVKSVWNISQTYNTRVIFNEVLLTLCDIEKQERHFYSFNVNKISCSKRYATISSKVISIKDDLFSNGNLCLVGATVDTNLKINTAILQNSYIAIEGIKSKYRKFSQIVSYLFTEESKSLKDFFIVFDTEEEPSKDNPIILELFFTPMFHYIEKFDENSYWDNSNINNLGNYTNNTITIKDYPFVNFENNKFLMDNRQELNIINGTTEQRPTNATIGFQYFDTTLNKPIWWNSTNWVDKDGNNADFKSKGTFAEKPSNPSIGFAYFCTDKQTTEGTTNGIMIYYEGGDVWVDALGRVISQE